MDEHEINKFKQEIADLNDWQLVNSARYHAMEGEYGEATILFNTLLERQGGAESLAQRYNDKYWKEQPDSPDPLEAIATVRNATLPLFELWSQGENLELLAGEASLLLRLLEEEQNAN